MIWLQSTSTGHVAQLSRRAAECYLLDIREAINAIREEIMPRMESRVWPAGLDRSILRTLPLQARTYNCLQSAHFMEGCEPIMAGQLLKIPGFGQTSLHNLLFTVEDFLNRCISTGDADSIETSESNEPARMPLASNSSEKVAEFPTSWKRAAQILEPVLATATELHGAKTLTDVLSTELRCLTDSMEITDAIDMIKISDLARGAHGVVSATLNRVSLTLDAASATERIIIKQRLLGSPEATLEEVGSQLGVTRERIRQIQARIESKVRKALGKDGAIITATLKEQLGSIVSQHEADRRIEEILPVNQSLATRIIQKTLFKDMGFKLSDGVYLDKSATEQLKDIQASIRGLVDDVGLLDEQQLVANLPGERWQLYRFWPWVRKRCGLHDLFGSLAIRNSGKAQAKAALISIGHPAKCEEIAQICGFGETKTASHLSVIPSVVKADKNRWGLKDWVDDEYEGIVGEIVQRIKEDGGATTIKRLLTELPEKFGVNPMSVRAYMQTSKFAICDGLISLAHPSSIQLRDLDDVIDGRDRDGAPYWTFTVEDRFLEGYSVTGVPPEFAKALGCAPDAGEHVRIENLPDYPELSINWRLASTTGASLGYLAKPLACLGLEPGQRARVSIKGYCLVELTADDRDAEDDRASGADVTLERMMQRRRLT